MEFLWFSTFRILSLNRDNFTSSFTNRMPFISLFLYSLSFFSVLPSFVFLSLPNLLSPLSPPPLSFFSDWKFQYWVKIEVAEVGLWFVPDCWRKASNYSRNMKLALCFSYIAFIMLKYFSSIPSLLSMFIMEKGVEFCCMVFLYQLRWSCVFCPFC